ncbi:diacylglycerol kinase [Hyunsoonleella pacifica]|uniref:Diacylglycerol kinase family protein n=1 Tax=Hyunsoonleella pacifica TaxID=1080224 RepID=A0A4Q9FQF0_9FLAO|nr:diacylglycerol kinase family protein [Hyunsoonleella pacifica]TBN17671.1 diacylglycerol kinase family protein [Hyunsoonleella pacifica]GGD09997.1 diacylglycerol kinase [Hyunsoonleella pacifica]
MNNKHEPFIIHRYKSIGYAFKGMLLLLKTESSIQVQFFLAIILTLAGFFFEISSLEWIIQIFTIILVMSVEALNTGLEKICDFVHEDFEERIGFIKDIAAGAVAISSLGALIIILILYTPKLIHIL